MIIVGGHIRFDPANREAVAEAATEVMAETVKEDGCILYNLSGDFSDDGLLHIYEEWETLESLDAHGNSAHIATFRNKLASLGVTERSVNRYTASERTPL